MIQQRKNINKWNRGWVLACCAICGGITGSIYMWSIFRNPLMEATGLDVSTVTFAYSLFLILVLFSQLFCPLILKVMKAGTLLGIAGIGFAAGWFLTGFADEPWKLFLYFSIIGGFSDGFIYNMTVSVALKWFPDKRGFASGICVGAMGLAPLLFAPLGNLFIQNLSVFMAFHICGIIFLFVRVIFGFFVRDPELGYLPKGWTQEQQTQALDSNDMTIPQMLKKPRAYVYWTMLFAAGCSGLIFTGHASAIAQEQAGVDASVGALLVGILALASFLGRFGFGSLSDRIGRFPTLMITFAITAVDMLFFVGATNTFATFTVAIFLIGMCFGGLMAIVPTLVSDAFGNKNFSGNYPYVYSGYTLASFVGPMMAAAAVSAAGNYSLAYIVGGVLSVFAIVVVIGLFIYDRKRKTATA